MDARLAETISDYKMYSKMLHVLSRKNNKEGIIEEVERKLSEAQDSYYRYQLPMTSPVRK